MFYEDIIKSTIGQKQDDKPLDSPLARFDQAVGNEYRREQIGGNRRSTSSIRMAEYMKMQGISIINKDGTIISKEAIIQQWQVSFKRAQEELDNLSQSQEAIDAARDQTLEGSFKGFTDLPTAYAQEQVIRGLQFDKDIITVDGRPDAGKQAAWWDNLIHSPSLKIKTLIINPCIGFTDDHFNRLWKRLGKSLERLEITHCPQLHQAFSSLRSDTLKELKLSQLPRVEIIYLKLPELAKLTIDNNEHLKTLTLKTPRLLTLNAYKATQLMELYIVAPDLQEVDFSYCKQLSDAHLSSMVRRCPEIAMMNLECCDHEKITYPFIKERVPSLAGVKWEGKQMVSLAAMVEDLLAHKLKELNVFEKFSGDRVFAGIAFKAIHAALLRNQSVETINLCISFMGDEETKLLAKTLEKNSNVKNLLLFEKNVTEVGIIALCDALEYNSAIKILLLGPTIGDVGAEALGRVFKKNHSIKNIILIANDITDIGAKKIADGLAHNKTLQTFVLMGNNISDIGAKEIAQALNKTRIQGFGLWANGMGDKGAAAFGMMLAGNRTMGGFCIASNNISDIGSAALFKGLASNQSIAMLGLMNATIGVTAAKEFANVLSSQDTNSCTLHFIPEANVPADLDHWDACSTPALVYAADRTPLYFLIRKQRYLPLEGSLISTVKIGGRLYLREESTMRRDSGQVDTPALVVTQNGSIKQLVVRRGESEQVIPVRGMFTEAECELLQAFVFKARAEGTGFSKYASPYLVRCNDPLINMLRRKVDLLANVDISGLPELLSHNMKTMLLPLDHPVLKKHISDHAFKLNDIFLIANGIDHEAMKLLGKGFERNQTTQSLWLIGNPIGSRRAEILARMVVQNAALKELLLPGCGIGDKEATLIANALNGVKRDGKLEMNLCINPIGVKGFRALNQLSNIENILFQLIKGKDFDETESHIGLKDPETAQSFATFCMEHISFLSRLLPTAISLMGSSFVKFVLRLAKGKFDYTAETPQNSFPQNPHIKFAKHQAEEENLEAQMTGWASKSLPDPAPVNSWDDLETDFMMAWQVQAGQMQKQLQQSLNEEKKEPASIKRSKYQLRLQDNAIPIAAKLASADKSSDSFFHAVQASGLLNLNRDMLVQCLLENGSDLNVRKAFVGEIRQILYLGYIGTHASLSENAVGQRMLTTECRLYFDRLMSAENQLQTGIKTARTLFPDQTHGLTYVELIQLLRDANTDYGFILEAFSQEVQKADEALQVYCGQHSVFEAYISEYMREARGHIVLLQSASGTRRVETSIDVINKLFDCNIQVYVEGAQIKRLLTCLTEPRSGKLPIPIFFNEDNCFLGLAIQSRKPLMHPTIGDNPQALLIDNESRLSLMQTLASLKEHFVFDEDRLQLTTESDFLLSQAELVVVQAEQCGILNDNVSQLRLTLAKHYIYTKMDAETTLLHLEYASISLPEEYQGELENIWLYTYYIQQQGNYSAIEHHLTRAQEYYDSHLDPQHTLYRIRLLSMQGHLALQRGLVFAAYDYFTNAYRIVTDELDPKGDKYTVTRSIALSNLAKIYSQIDFTNYDLDRAQQYCEQALALHATSSSGAPRKTLTEGMQRHQIAALLTQQKHYNHAENAYHEAQLVYDSIWGLEPSQEKVYLLRDLALLQYLQGKVSAADNYFDQAEKIAGVLEDPVCSASFLRDKCDYLLSKKSDKQDIHKGYMEVVRVFTQFNRLDDVAWAYQRLAAVAITNKQESETIALHEKAIDLLKTHYREEKHPAIAQLYIKIVLDWLSCDSYNRVLDYLEMVLAIHQTLNPPIPRQLLLFCDELSRIYSDKKRYADLLHCSKAVLVLLPQLPPTAIPDALTVMIRIVDAYIRIESQEDIIEEVNEICGQILTQFNHLNAQAVEPTIKTINAYFKKISKNSATPMGSWIERYAAVLEDRLSVATESERVTILCAFHDISLALRIAKLHASAKTYAQRWITLEQRFPLIQLSSRLEWYMDLAQIYKDMCAIPEAILLYEQAVALYADTVHRSRQELKNEPGEASKDLLKTDDSDDSSEEEENSYQAPSISQLIILHDCLASCYVSERDLAKAKIFYTETLSFFEKLLAMRLIKLLQALSMFHSNGDPLENDREESPIGRLFYYTKCLSENPYDRKSHLALANLYHVHDMVNQAIQHFELGLNIAPDTSFDMETSAEIQASAHHNLGCCYHIREKFNESEVFFVKALELKPSGSTHCDYGLLLMHQSRWEDAITQLNKAVERGDDGSGLYYGAVEKPLLDENLQAEIEDTNLNITPSILARYWLIRCYKALGKCVEAQEALNRLQEYIELQDSILPLHNRVLSYACDLLNNNTGSEILPRVSLIPSQNLLKDRNVTPAPRVALQATADDNIKPDTQHENEVNHSEEFFVVENSLQQRGWNCFDIALDLPNLLEIFIDDPDRNTAARQQLVAIAISKKEDLTYRQLLAPEIRTAAAITAVIMNIKRAHEQHAEQQRTEKLAELFNLLEIAKQFGNTQDQSILEQDIYTLLNQPLLDSPNIRDIRQLALPEVMHTAELCQLVNNYNDAHEAMKEEVRDCNKLLNRAEGNILPYSDLIRFFDIQDNSDNYPEAYRLFLNIQINFSVYEKAFFDYCEREDIYEAYLIHYYGKQQWVSFQPNTAGPQAQNTSMVDIAARCVNRQIIIYQMRGDQRIEIYRTESLLGQGGILHIQYNGYNHFVALQSDPTFIAGTRLELGKYLGLSQESPQRGSIDSQLIESLILQYLTGNDSFIKLAPLDSTSQAIPGEQKAQDSAPMLSLTTKPSPITAVAVGIDRPEQNVFPNEKEDSQSVQLPPHSIIAPQPLNQPISSCPGNSAMSAAVPVISSGAALSSPLPLFAGHASTMFGTLANPQHSNCFDRNRPNTAMSLEELTVEQSRLQAQIRKRQEDKHDPVFLIQMLDTVEAEIKDRKIKLSLEASAQP